MTEINKKEETKKTDKDGKMSGGGCGSGGCGCQ